MQDNWLLLTADYSQIELRLMAHFSKDSSLIELLSKPDGDVFTMIAARWTGKPIESVDSNERDQTKRLVYGILYGMGANTLAEQLHCSSGEAAENIRSFKSSFPGVASWLRDAVASCRQKGWGYFINFLLAHCYLPLSLLLYKDKDDARDWVWEFRNIFFCILLMDYPIFCSLLSLFVLYKAFFLKSMTLKVIRFCILFISFIFHTRAYVHLSFFL